MAVTGSVRRARHFSSHPTLYLIFTLVISNEIDFRVPPPHVTPPSSKPFQFSPFVLLFEEMIEIDPVIIEYEHEKFRPREAEALQTLRRVASLVKPIMRRRGWKVGILTEFWPPEKNLLGLNWNKGQKICLRLRYPYDERQFLPIEEVVDTMLHE